MSTNGDATITEVASQSTSQSWTRAQVLRLVNISERQLAGWERRNFVATQTQYGFSDLIALRMLCSLREQKITPSRIQRIMEVLRGKLEQAGNPLSVARIFLDGKKLRAEIEGQKIEAMTGQLLLDFDKAEVRRLVAFARKENPGEEKRKQQALVAEADEFFQKGLEVEQTGGPVAAAIEAYEKAIELNPNAAGALVNLGTIHFHMRRWKKAESFYQSAITADPEYALAHFNLGNLFDERGDRDHAQEAYFDALRINPRYADAHYNLALLYQGEGDTMKAISHWKTYLKLDAGSDWAKVAQRELEKLTRTIKNSAGIKIVKREQA